MKVLNAYLRDLLILHDCVILPDFGGFVGNYESAKKSETDYFTPPRKNIAFNPQLKNNDGLLANTIVAIEKVNYDEAMQRIGAFTAKIHKELKAKGEYVIPQVGKLQKNSEQRLLFTPDTTSNLLASPIGLQAFQMTPIQRTASIEKQEKGKVVAMPVLRKVLVASVSAVALLSLLSRPTNFENLSFASLSPTFHETSMKVQEEPQIETATEPALTKNQVAVMTEKEVSNNEVETVSVATPKMYHIVVGCFSMAENAEVQKNKLAKKGVETHVFPYNKTMTAVSAGSFSNFADAKVVMDELRHSGKAPSAWVLKRTILN